jgi:predicted membrane protein
METTNQTNGSSFWTEHENREKRGKIASGLLIVALGILFLTREFGVIYPSWLFSWKTFLIAIGFVIGFKNKFKNSFWFFPIIIGLGFLIGDFYPELAIKRFLWPLMLIMFGIIIMLKPRRKHHHWKKRKMMGNYYQYQQETATDEQLDITTFMGGVKKNIISKNFRGGEITNVFGGTEINLSQADFENTVTLDVTNVFGGTKLILPANWEVVSNVVSVFGSVEDKRPMQTGVNSESGKVLILKGTSIMGGVDIKSY